MADLNERASALHMRIKKRRVEVYQHLDRVLYNDAKFVVEQLIAADERGLFAGDPTDLPGYILNIRNPMWWNRISKKLDRYEYRSAEAVISDLRLVVENSFQYNGKRSELAAVTRKVEMKMESLIVEKLGGEPTKATDIAQLGKGLSRPQAAEVWNIACLYEGLPNENGSRKVSLQLGSLHLATRRRIVLYLRQSAKVPPPEARGSSVTRPVGASQAPPRQQRPAAPTAPKQTTVPPVRDTQHLMHDGDEVQFHREEKSPVLEPVPQNQRGMTDAFKGMSPVHMDDSADDEGEQGV